MTATRWLHEPPCARIQTLWDHSSQCIQAQKILSLGHEPYVSKHRWFLCHDLRIWLTHFPLLSLLKIFIETQVNYRDES